jgi:hypothetical protein
MRAIIRNDFVKRCGTGDAAPFNNPGSCYPVGSPREQTLWRQGPLPRTPHAVSSVVEAQKPRLKQHLSRR